MSNSDWGAIPRQLAEDVSLTLKKKFNVQTGFKPVEWNKNIKALTPLTEKTVSGSVVAFSDGADDVPLKSCAVTIAPNLDGVSSVGVVQSGTNLLLPNSADRSGLTNGISYSYDSATQTFSFNGTNGKTDANWLIFNRTELTFDGVKIGATYYFSHTLPANMYAQITYKDSNNSNHALVYLAGNASKNASVSFTIPNDFASLNNFQIGVARTLGAIDDTAVFMISEFASADYEAYTTPTTHTAALGRTIYGGTADIVNGIGTETAEKAVLDPTETWLYSSSWSKTNTNVFYTQATHDEISFSTWSDNSILLCDALPVGTRNEINNADTNMIGVSGNVGHPCITVRIDKTTCPDLTSFIQYITNNQISFVYKKATPEDFTFTAVPIISRLGDNTMWGDGDLSVVYRYESGDPSFETVLSSNPLLELTGVSGTDVSRNIWTYTATDNCKIKFHSNTQVRTNTSSNDGYFTVKKNDTVIASIYANTSTTTQFPIPDIELESGDTVTITGGFDNYHTSCWFDVYSTITILHVDN